MILSNEFINTEVSATGRWTVRKWDNVLSLQAVGPECVSHECWKIIVFLQNRGTGVFRVGVLACTGVSKDIDHLTH